MLLCYMAVIHFWVKQGWGQFNFISVNQEVDYPLG